MESVIDCGFVLTPKGEAKPPVERDCGLPSAAGPRKQEEPPVEAAGNADDSEPAKVETTKAPDKRSPRK